MRGDRIKDPLNISSDESVDSSSDESADTSSDERVHTRVQTQLGMRGDRMEDHVNISSDESVDSSSDESADRSSDKRIYYRMKKKKLQKKCKDVCDCPSNYTVGRDPNSEAEWMYAKKFTMSMCARKRLRCYVHSAKPAIRHYVCEMNKTFTKAGQRMYFSALFTKKHLMKFLSTPVDRMWIKLSSGRCATYVRLLNGVDSRAIITHNWSHFAKKAKLTEGEICVFLLRISKGQPAFIVHKI